MKLKFLSIVTLFAAHTFLSAQYSSGALFPVGTTGVSVKLETTPSIVRLTIAGPSNSYLGIGAGSSGMANGADGFIYNSSAATDYTFAGIGLTPTADAAQDWTTVSNTVSGSTRTIVATRSLAGGTGDTPIPNVAGNIEIFVARGNNTLAISNHGPSNRGYATLPMAFDASLATNESAAAAAPRYSLYPNPAKEFINFENADKIKSVDIFESTGRKVRTESVEGKSINISDLKSGTYYLELTLKDGNIIFEKLIKE